MSTFSLSGKVAGIDISKSMIEQAKAQHEAPNVFYKVSDCSTEFGFSNEFDVANAVYLLNYR